MAVTGRTPQPPGGPGRSTGKFAAAGETRDFAAIAVERGYCTAQQVAQALAGQPAGVDVRAALVQSGVLTEDQARACDRAVRGATMIAGFEILEKLGQGGMGAVFRARQVSMDRIVALKILPPKLAQDENFKQRFIHEARLSAKLSHLNIIAGIDCGDSGGYTFFAMEFVDGRTVKQVLTEKGKLAPAEAFSIVRQIAEALVYAESRGMVHRDIKPDNIMLTKDGTAKLCDLGLAKQHLDDASLTQDGLAVGTPHYISPEQAKGEKSVDTRSDIYSLGATFYHLLAGKTPFDAPTGASVMALHITDETKNPCDGDPMVPTSYGQILSKMMAKSAADRYATAQELIEDLDAAKSKRVPKAATFRAKTSCAWPRRLGHYATGPQAPVGAAPGAEPQAEAGSRKPLVLVAAALVLALGGGAFWYFGMRKQDEPTEMAKADPKVVAQPPEPKVKTPPAPQPATKEPAVQKTEAAKTEAVIPEPKVKEPEPKTKTKTEEPKVPVPEPKTPPPEPVVVKVEPEKEPDPPKFEVTAEMLYARLLGEFKKPAAKGDLRKFLEDLRELGAKSDFEIARKDVTAELEDVNAAIAFEGQALKAMAAAGGSLELNEETARKWQSKKGKIVGFDEAKGISVDVNGPVFYITAAALPLNDLLKFVPDKSPLGQLRYLCARGYQSEALALLSRLGDKDKPRWERKLRLLVTGELELRAQAVFNNLATVADGKYWRTYAPMAAEFDKVYGNTSAANENVVKLMQWKAASKAALTPTEGLECTGKYTPVRWPNVNACEVQVVTDADTGNKTLRIEGKAGASLLGEGEKSAVVRTEAPPLNLVGKTQVVFRAKHKANKPLPVAVGLMLDQYYESTPAVVAPGAWGEYSIKLVGPVFKSGNTKYLSYDTALPSHHPTALFVLVYTKEPYIIEIDGITPK